MQQEEVCMSETDTYGQDNFQTDREPLDVVERIAEEEGWDFKRHTDNEIIISVLGNWCNYSMSFIWNDEVQAMHFACMFDIRVRPKDKGQIYELLAMINEEIWLGHFGLWHEDGLLMFRHTILFRDAAGPSYEQVEDIVKVAIDECNRFYPAFQHVIWNGRSAEDAISLSMIDCVGNA